MSQNNIERVVFFTAQLVYEILREIGKKMYCVREQ